ncbi:hypothetical protein [Chroococcidiopsis sp.]|uniref:hypothetical protein n=1 Tax=Chroococcidiopsis sp. TaxID=3088168 RepID=UPI003F39D713
MSRFPVPSVSKDGQKRISLKVEFRVDLLTIQQAILLMFLGYCESSNNFVGRWVDIEELSLDQIEDALSGFSSGILASDVMTHLKTLYHDRGTGWWSLKEDWDKGMTTDNIQAVDHGIESITSRLFGKYFT